MPAEYRGSRFMRTRTGELRLLPFWRQTEGNSLVLKMSFVGAITEGLVLGTATTTDGDNFPSAKVVFIAILVNDLKITFYFNRAITIDCNLCGSHAGCIRARK